MAERAARTRALAEPAADHNVTIESVQLMDERIEAVVTLIAS